MNKTQISGTASLAAALFLSAGAYPAIALSDRPASVHTRKDVTAAGNVKWYNACVARINDIGERMKAPVPYEIKDWTETSEGKEFVAVQKLTARSGNVVIVTTKFKCWLGADSMVTIGDFHTE